MARGLDGGSVAPESVMAAAPGVAPALFELLIGAGAVDALKRAD